MTEIARMRLCLDMHSKQAGTRAGETEQRLYGLNAWRETPYYSARERAALECTEALTLVTEGRVSLAMVAINDADRYPKAASIRTCWRRSFG